MRNSIVIIGKVFKNHSCIFIGNNHFAGAIAFLCQQRGQSAIGRSFHTFNRTGDNVKCFCVVRNNEKYVDFLQNRSITDLLVCRTVQLAVWLFPARQLLKNKPDKDRLFMKAKHLQFVTATISYMNHMHRTPAILPSGPIFWTCNKTPLQFGSVWSLVVQFGMVCRVVLSGPVWNGVPSGP